MSEHSFIGGICLVVVPIMVLACMMYLIIWPPHREPQLSAEPFKHSSEKK